MNVPKKETLTWRQQAQAAWAQKVKPLGSLGRLEEFGTRLAELQRTVKPDVGLKRLIIFAASHGIAAEGVSAYPASVTAEMVQTIVEGGAAINVMSRNGRIGLHLIDIGVDAERGYCKEQPPLSYRSVRRGTRSFLHEPAMTPDELAKAFEAGREAVNRAKEDNIQLLGLGEIGIGNTTSAAALMCAMLKCPVEDAVGHGTGIDEQRLAHKIAVVKQALELHKSATTPFEWLQRVGGYEIAAMTGSILQAHKANLPIVIDGFVVSVAALVAHRMDPNIDRVCFFAHRSAEKAHGKILEKLRAKPMLELGMRLGEGTGAALAMDLLDISCRLLRDMATFESAKVSTKL